MAGEPTPTDPLSGRAGDTLESEIYNDRCVVAGDIS